MRTLVLVAVFVVGLSSVLIAEEPKPKANDDAKPKPADAAQTFGTKILILSVKDSPYGVYLTKANVRKMGSREFLAGQTVNLPGTPAYPSMNMWVPISDITMVMEFDSLEKAAEAVRLQQEAEGRQQGDEASSLKTR